MKQKFIRKGNIITDMAGKVLFKGQWGADKRKRPSINAAKRESRKLQGNSLGLGLLRVVA